MNRIKPLGKGFDYVLLYLGHGIRIPEDQDPESDVYTLNVNIDKGIPGNYARLCTIRPGDKEVHLNPDYPIQWHVDTMLRFCEIRGYTPSAVLPDGFLPDSLTG